jgi:hypothetical protein
MKQGGGVKSGPSGQTNKAERPDAKGIEGSVRTALKNYIEKTLFNPDDPEGAEFRASILDGRDDAGREAAKKEMLAQASRWMPKARGWERTIVGDTAVYAGRLFQVHTEVTLDKTGKPMAVKVSIENE